MRSYVFPGDIEERISAIGSQPIPYMRTDEFSRINKDSERILLNLIHCKNGRAILYTGSGTGAMSATVENYVSTKKKALVIDGGSFGHRWYEMCRYYGIPVFNYLVPFAQDIDYNDLEKTLSREKPDVFLCQHHETSTGQLFNLEKISAICRRHKISLVVDAISSFLAEELDMDALEIDICIVSSQKGLNIPPGLSVVFLRKNLNGHPWGRKGYYWDFEDNLRNLSRGQTPFSPATTLFLQLHARLEQLEAEGGEVKNIARVHHRAGIFRRLCREYGWEIPAEVPSFAITGFQTKEKTPGKVFRSLIEKHQTFIMPGDRPGFYRVSHMGLQTEEDLRELAARIHEFEAE